MLVSRWFLFAGLVAYCGDVALYAGVHADAMIGLMRHVARGILLALLYYA
jgi:hypothetical protein